MNDILRKCPNCGASIEHNYNHKCPYCRTSLHMTDEKIRELNNLTSNILSIVQVLILPNKQLEQPKEYLTYTVKKGDSLYQIAKKNNTTVNELKNLNNLTGNLLSIGQELKIPR